MMTRSQVDALASPCIVILAALGIVEIGKRLWWRFAP